jgi:hypothetical protein
VVIPLGDMFERGELTNVLEDRNFCKEEILQFLRKINSQELRINEFFKDPIIF